METGALEGRGGAGGGEEDGGGDRLNSSRSCFFDMVGGGPGVMEGERSNLTAVGGAWTC